MAIIIKTEDQIKLIRESCRLLAIVHKELEEMIRPGITTREIDIRGDSLIRKLGGFRISSITMDFRRASACL